jgi:hypothetical protein
MDRRLTLEASVPASAPQASTSLLFGPSAWQEGGTSACTSAVVSARPPSRGWSEGRGVLPTVRVRQLTRIMQGEVFCVFSFRGYELTIFS